jgi:hypothetical protein
VALKVVIFLHFDNIEDFDLSGTVSDGQLVVIAK